MSKRFFYKVYTSGEVDFFDNEQEYVNEKYTCDDVRGLHPMDYWELVELLNEQQATIEQLERKLELKTEEVEYLKRMMVKWGMVKDE